MNTITKRAYAKINLVLQIVGKMDDGYHSLNTTMQQISLYDTITITKTTGDKIEIKCNLPYVPMDERNIAHKAATLFFEELKMQNVGLKIDIIKRIPVGAGLAGGSSDAGAVLTGLNELFAGGISMERLMKMGGSLGADVPFTMQGGAAKAEGRGDVLTPVSALKNCHIVVCKPRFSMSTKEAFGLITPEEYSNENLSDTMEKLLREGNNNKIAKSLYNTFEKVIGERRPQIFTIKSKLCSFGAVGTLMTGSGSAVYGIFTNLNRANMAVFELKKQFSDVYVAQPM